VEGDALLVAPLRSGAVAVLNCADGREVNRFQLEAESEIVAEPVFLDRTLTLLTNKGLVVVTVASRDHAETKAVKK
jgi:hypothetical protein